MNIQNTISACSKFARCLIVASLPTWCVLIGTPGFAQSPAEELNLRLNGLQKQMASIASSIEKGIPGGTLIDDQKAIVNELSLLIRQLSAGEQSGSPNATPKSTPGSSQSSTSQGTGQATADSSESSDESSIPKPPMTARQLILKAWGDMPGQLRDQRGTGISPEFLPKYDRLIREYYQRMSR